MGLSVASGGIQTATVGRCIRASASVLPRLLTTASGPWPRRQHRPNTSACREDNRQRRSASDWRHRSDRLRRATLNQRQRINGRHASIHHCTNMCWSTEHLSLLDVDGHVAANTSSCARSSLGTARDDVVTATRIALDKVRRCRQTSPL